MPESNIIINIGAGNFIIGLITIFSALLTIIWKGKQEIAHAIEPIQKTNSAMLLAIVEIQTILKNKFKGLVIEHAIIERGNSPLVPTNYGASLITQSGLEKVITTNKEYLFIKLQAQLPKNYTEYDVQEHARQLLVDLKDDPIMIPVKNWVYQNPIDISFVLMAGGLWLRDDFLNIPRRFED